MNITGEKIGLSSQSLKRLTIINAVLSIVVAILGLLSYIPGLRVLGSVKEDYIPMAPSTALSFIILGIIILRLPNIEQQSLGRKMGYFSALVVAIFGLLEVIGSLVGKDLNYEHRVVPSDEMLGSIPVGRMAYSTGAVFFFAGIGIIGLIATRSRYQKITRFGHKTGIIASLIMFTSLVFILAYAYGTPLMYNQGSTIPMAITTALGFLLLGLSILASSNKDSIPLRFFTRSDTPTRLLITFFPICILAVLLGSFVTIIALRLSNVNSAILAATFAVIIATLSIIAVNWISVSVGESIDRAETERKRAEVELQKSHEQLYQSQKMEAIGRLAGGIAHDFNNMLTSIIGYSEIIEDGLPDNNILRDYCREIIKASNRSAGLIKQLLSFSKKQNVKPSIIDINSVIMDMKSMIRLLIGENITLKVNLRENISNTFIDSSQFDQILINLVVNAKEAMPNGGKLTIDTKNITNLDEYDFSNNNLILPLVMLSVTDTGIGITDEIKDKIFEPFFTTKKQSVGLGLATIYGIIDQAKAHIHVKSQIDKGTSFQIFFPATEEVISDRQSELQDEIKLDPKSLCIMVIEDDAILLKLIKTILIESEFDVYAFDNPLAALKFYQDSKIKFDLIISDVILPDMNGVEMLEKMKKIRTIHQVLFITGYTEIPIYQDILEKYNLLEKPFTKNELLSNILSLFAPKHVEEARYRID